MVTNIMKNYQITKALQTLILNNMRHVHPLWAHLNEEKWTHQDMSFTAYIPAESAQEDSILGKKQSACTGPKSTTWVFDKHNSLSDINLTASGLGKNRGVLTCGRLKKRKTLYQTIIVWQESKIRFVCRDLCHKRRWNSEENKMKIRQKTFNGK